jgi:hypothetical protein
MLLRMMITMMEKASNCQALIYATMTTTTMVREDLSAGNQIQAPLHIAPYIAIHMRYRYDDDDDDENLVEM